MKMQKIKVNQNKIKEEINKKQIKNQIKNKIAKNQKIKKKIIKNQKMKNKVVMIDQHILIKEMKKLNKLRRPIKKKKDNIEDKSKNQNSQ